MLLNKKAVRKNKTIKKIQKADRKINRDRKLDRGSKIKNNIEKVVALSSEKAIGYTEVKDQTALKEVNAAQLISELETHALTGMSGSGFPVAKKVKTFLEAGKKQKIIIINGAECEPGLLHDAWLMRHKGKEISEAALALKKILAANRVILAVRGKAEAVSGLATKDMEIVRVPLKYPLGEEHVLIKHVLGMELQNDVIPAKEGILLTNVQTVYQMGRILKDSYDGSRFVTIANLETGEARVAYVNPKTKVKDLLVQTFGKTDAGYYAGGGVMSAVEAGENDTFGNACSFAGIAKAAAISNDNRCKKCGGCTKKCPAGISVREIVLAKEKNPNADLSQWRPERCLHCGTCTYFCMAGKDPASYMM